MKISYNWLKQFINIDWDPEKTGALLTDLGLEIEGIDRFESVLGGLEGVVVGHVLECGQHPNADRLKLTKVDIGAEEPVQIVCGAPNVDKGQKVPVATVGTTLYDAEGKPWKIKKGKIRGEVSMGMICAEDELGLGDSHDGIMVLDEALTPGTPMNTVVDVEIDHVFEIGLTPNRADAMSHWGTARDLRAGLLQQEINIELITPSNTNFRVDNRSNKIDVKVDNNELAPRYCGVTISGLQVAPSPKWLQNRLKAIGLTPKNNVVDITNYVLHDLGQPLHAFDVAKIQGGVVEVKTLEAGTKFTTLDGEERSLHQDDLMICDAEKPMCIAGVFGGLVSGVTDQTTAIFLESAYFDPVSVRKTAKRHGLNTDASFRFERGIDPNITEYALMRAAILIKELAGGEITSDVIDIYPKKIEDHQVVLNFDNAARLIGQEIPRETIKSILTSLDIKINNVTETGIGMTIPAYRNDVTREADVVEEVLRVYGYNNIDFGKKLNASISENKRIEDYRIQNITANQLTAIGFNEMLANSLTKPDYINLTATLDEEQNVAMLNPLSNDLSVLRQSMLFTTLEAVAYNKNRKAGSIKLYEFGKTYHQEGDSRIEHKHLAVIAEGTVYPDHWAHNGSTEIDFFYLKGVVSGILERLGLTKYTEQPNSADIFSEGISLKMGDTELVALGVVHPKITGHFAISSPVFYADFNWDAVLAALSTGEILFKNISKYPAVKRDFALLLDEGVSFEALHATAFATERKLLKEVQLFDVYTGKSLPKGKKSYALSFTLADENKTLTDKQIDKIMGRLQQAFETKFEAQLR
ncbi:phenylalanine--tRNA ligase subunit beta [Gilvibacter sp.]|uniref:phenylalanine--tRNA ligase subunit beta n=1 Tax=Gilvibacter sp. TaxID=2729997 RepID=UPI003F4A5D56